MKNSVLKIACYSLFGLAATLQSFVANADLLLDKVVVVFDDPKQTKKDVGVINDDATERLFVSVEAYQVDQPGTEEESLIALTNDDNPSFLASPSKLIVEPDSTNVVRLLNLQPDSEEERVYRVNYLPIQKPIELDGIPEAEGVSPVIEIVLAYQVLAIVLPLNPSPKPVVTRNGNTVVFSNEGNANYLLSDGRQCDPADATKCLDLPGHRVYAQSSWTLKLPFDGPAKYSLRTQVGSRPLAIQ